MVNGFRPASLQEALEILAAEKCVPYAGGTDLMVERREGVSYCFIGRLPELRRITADGETVRIGAAVTFSEALDSSLVPPIMKEAVSHIAAPAVRNAGTFGGNLGNGAGKADSVPVEIAADARMRIVSLRGEREISVESFYQGYRKLDLKPDELIAEIILPARGLERYYYEKVAGRNALAISRVSFAGIFSEENGVITNAAAAFGAVYGLVLRYRDLEKILVGKTVEEAGKMKKDTLKAYERRISEVLLADRVCEAYRTAVCVNLLDEFLKKFGI